MKIRFKLQGNTLEYENDAITEDSEMGLAFGDGDEEHNYCNAQNWQDFIGTAFHLIQQTGGLLKLNGQLIRATNLKGTDGSSVTKDTLVALADGETLALSHMLKN